MAGYLADFLGVEAPQLDVHWVPDDITLYCSPADDPVESGLGCANPDGMFSIYALHQHEMVHALRPGSLGAPPLEEGLAEFLGDDWSSTAALVGDEVGMFAQHDGAEHLLDRSWYPLAALFASFINARYGSDSLVSLVDATWPGQSFDSTRAAFDELLGQSFENIVRERDDTYLPCDRTSSRDNGYDCAQQAYSGPAEPGEQLLINIAMDCGESDVLGPRRGERWKTIVIEIPRTGVYSLAADKVGGSGSGELRFRRCGQSCFDEFAAFTFVLGDAGTTRVNPVEAPRESSEPPFPDLGCVAAGRYTVRASVEADDVGWLQLRLGNVQHEGCEFLE